MSEKVNSRENYLSLKLRGVRDKEVNIQINFATFQSSYSSFLFFFSENCEGRDFPLYTPLLHDEDVLTTDFLGRRVQLNFVTRMECLFRRN